MNLFARLYLQGRSLRIRTVRRSRGDQEYDLLPMLVKRGMTAVDVGANRGVYTFPMARRAKEVVAYEPNPWIAGFLASGAPKNVRVRNVAVSDKPGEVTLRVPRRADGKLAHNQGSIERYGEEGTVSATVAAVRLDDENLGPVGFIKLDAEDHEIPVIRGAENLIRRDRPNLLVEVLGFSANDRWPPLRDLMAGLGYQAYVLKDGALEPATVAEGAAAGAVGLNVVFLPGGGPV